MAYSYQIKPVIDLVRALLLTTLVAAGETPDSIPLSTTQEQVLMTLTQWPRTIIQAKTATIEDMGTSDFITLPLVIHHIREVETDGSAAEIAMVRLSAVAAAFKNDYRLHGVLMTGGLTGADVPINSVRPDRLILGEDNELQQMLDLNEQGLSLVAASLAIEITWYEGVY